MQEGYVERKLLEGPYSPRTRAGWLLGLSDGLTILILVLTLVIALGPFFHFAHVGSGAAAKPAPWLLLIAGLSGVFTAGVVALRILNEGLQLRSEAERYEWYLASIASIERRFEAGGVIKRVELLREMEHIAYREMRRFLIDFEGAFRDVSDNGRPRFTVRAENRAILCQSSPRRGTSASGDSALAAESCRSISDRGAQAATRDLVIGI